ncbi:MAG: hypothetical protein AAAB13_08650 [Pseudomonas sp.]
MHTVRQISLLSLFCISCALVGGVSADEQSSAMKTAELTLPGYAFAGGLSIVPLHLAQQPRPVRAATPAANQPPAQQGQWLRISDDGDTETAQQPQRPQRWVF